MIFEAGDPTVQRQAVTWDKQPHGRGRGSWSLHVTVSCAAERSREADPSVRDRWG